MSTLIELSQNHMNTTFAVTVSAPESRIAAAEAEILNCHAAISELEDILSEFKSGSDPSRLKTAAVDEWIEVSSHTSAIIEESMRIAEWSNQVFNPAFRSQNGRKLSENFKFHPAQKYRLAKQTPTSVLGFGAIGKGYALDLVHQRLTQAGFTNHRLIGGGSSLVFSGLENTGVPWTVGFAFEKEGGQYRGLEYRCLTSPLFVGVSGFLEQGQHIVRLIPETGHEHPPKLVAVTASSCARADAFSTAIYANPNLAEKYVDGAFILIDDEERLYSNHAFNKYFGRSP